MREIRKWEGNSDFQFSTLKTSCGYLLSVEQIPWNYIISPVINCTNIIIVKRTTTQVLIKSKGKEFIIYTNVDQIQLINFHTNVTKM